MRTHEILEEKKLFTPEDTAPGIVPFERGAIGFSSSIAFQNALNHGNQTITSEVTLFLAIATICIQFVTSVFFSSVIDHDPPTQIRRYYGMILTFDNYRRPLNLLIQISGSRYSRMQPLPLIGCCRIHQTSISYPTTINSKIFLSRVYSSPPVVSNGASNTMRYNRIQAGHTAYM